MILLCAYHEMNRFFTTSFAFFREKYNPQPTKSAHDHLLYQKIGHAVDADVHA